MNAVNKLKKKKTFTFLNSKLQMTRVSTHLQYLVFTHIYTYYRKYTYTPISSLDIYQVIGAFSTCPMDDAPVDPIRNERPFDPFYARLCADGFPADCVGARSPARVVSAPPRGRTWDRTRSDGFVDREDNLV